MSTTEHEARVVTLGIVKEAFRRMNEFEFLALPAIKASVKGQSGCRFTLESEFRFFMDRPLQIECFSDKPHATKWIARTLLSILSNLGIQEVHDYYCGPNLERFAICNEEGTLIEIR